MAAPPSSVSSIEQQIEQLNHKIEEVEKEIQKTTKRQDEFNEAILQTKDKGRQELLGKQVSDLQKREEALREDKKALIKAQEAEKEEQRKEKEHQRMKEAKELELRLRQTTPSSITQAAATGECRKTNSNNLFPCFFFLSFFFLFSNIKHFSDSLSLSLT